MAKACNTINTVLKSGTSSTNLTKLCKIKSYPDLGGTPEQLETTDLEDESQTYIDGVQSLEAMEFTANYTKNSYDSVLETSGKEQQYQLEFGKDGEQGIFSWTGTHTVKVNGGEVNGVREMTISCTPSTKIENKALE